MLPSRPLIAMIGAGGVGCYYGGRLAQHGHDVHFLLRSDFAAVRQQGLKVQSCDGDFLLPPDQIHVYDDPQRMPRADLVIVTLKSTANDQLQRLIAPLLGARTLILTLQNGLGSEEELARLFGEQRIIGGMAFVCINRIAPGEVHHIDAGLVQIGEYRGGASDRVRQIARMLAESQIRCEVLEDLRRGRWEKLVWNIPFNGLGAAMDLTTGELLASEEGQRLVRSLMAEVIAIARAEGVDFPPDLPDRKIAVTRTMGHYRTSTHVDRQQGREMEIDAIWGKPLQVAQRHQIDTPLLKTIHTMLLTLASRGV